MPTKPTYNIGDVVYSKESAALGELDAFKIGSIHQKSPGVWVYQFYINKRPPDQQTVEDRIDLRTTSNLFFEESDLINLCGALHLAITNVQARINKVFVRQQICGTGADPVGVPLFDLNNVVHIKASAEIGFLETHKVIEIHRAPDSAEFIYRLDTDGAKVSTNPLFSVSAPKSEWPVLYFRERELVSECQALNMVMAALERKISRLLAIKLALCVSNPTEGSNPSGSH